MVTLNSTNNKFSIALQIESDGYIGSPAYFGYINSRSEAIVKLAAGVAAGIYEYKVSVNINLTTYQVTYVSNTDGSLVFSLQKFFIMAGEGTPISFTIEADMNGVEGVTITINVLNGISYQDIIAPMNNDLQGFSQKYGARHNIVPPNVMLIQQLGPDIIAETSLGNVLIPYATLPNAVWTGIGSGSPVTIKTQGVRYNEIQIYNSYNRLVYTETIGQTQKQHTWNLEQPETCADIVMLEWTSQTGAKRRHLFYISELISQVDESARLISLHDGFKVAKNVSNGFKIRLDGLTPYSHWYYSDMILASDLKAGIPIEWINDFQEVVCTNTNSNTVPNSKGFVTFEATIRYKHYDSY